MNNREKQYQEECDVFSDFARTIPLPLVPRTTRPGSDPPDILCDLQSGETLAFELVQCEDETRDGAGPDGYSSVLQRRVIEHISFKDALCKAYCEALAAGSIDQPHHFRSHVVRLHFDESRFPNNGFPGTSCRQKVARRIIELLNQYGPGFHLINDGRIRSINCELDPHSPSEEPRFCFPTGCGVRPCIVERIKGKIAKDYELDHKAHLLAWSTTATVSEFNGLRKDKELTELLRSKGMGAFERIWVFGYRNQSIVFDSADFVSDVH